MKKRFQQAKGKIRRYVLVHFKPDYVRQQKGLRQGECNQCGNCCEILFKCPFLLREEDGAAICSIYDDRPGQCAAFPIDDACLEEVDFDCTFEFSGSDDTLVVIEEPTRIEQTMVDSDPEPTPVSGRLKQTKPIPVLLFNHLLNRLR